MSEAKYKPYPEYKDPGVEWLGDVPVGWEVKRLSHFFDVRNTKVSDKDYKPLSVTKQGIVPQLETAAKTDAGDNRKLVKINDFVINSRSDRKGSSGISEYDGSVSLISIVLKPEKIFPGYVHHLLRSYPFQEEFYRFGKGIVADLWSTNFSEMKNILLPTLSFSEQTQIAAFLDHETAKIDNLIEKQKRLIELLKEKRQAVISHAVTKGLNPDVPMKDSGVEWLGEVPEHWELKKIKHFLLKIEQGWSPQCDAQVAEDNEFGVLKVGCVNGGIFKPEENKVLPNSLSPKIEYKIKKSDLLISRANTKELVGSAAVVDKDYNNLLLCDKLYRLRFFSYIDPNYISFYLSASIIRQQIELDATGASNSMQNIGQSTVLNLSIPIPPEPEMKVITNYLDGRLDTIDKSESKAKKQISLLQERRTALISAAVTGKIDVRDWKPPESQEDESNISVEEVCSI